MITSATVTDEISGARFAQALQSGIHRVILEQENLNRINVFPVADGDTGTNLSLSLGASLQTLTLAAGKRLNTLLAAVADALLDGARGNSGAIMAQFFQGLSDSAENLTEFTADSFARAVALGSDYAHDAIAEPKQGTILSVIAAFADSLRDQTTERTPRSFASRLQHALAVAQSALHKTETQLEVLRKAGVVDAGAKGFVVMLEGIYDLLANGRATDKPDLADLLEDEALADVAGMAADLQFRYCTECMITGHNIDRRKLREALSATGNSLVLAGTKRKAKIHIHVNDPEAVFGIARRFGTLGSQKADDMQRQRHSSHDTRAKFAVITDSAADIPDADLERLDIHMVPLRVQFGDRGYLDKVSISPDRFFDELQSNSAHPTTSQPAPGDFRRQFQFLASHFSDVISVNLSGAVSGTKQAAQAAAGRVRAGGKIHVIDTRNASLGQGLLAVMAAEFAAAGKSAEEIIENLRLAIPETHSYALIEDLSYAVRGGRVPKYVKLAADLLRITPVLRTSPEGRVGAGGVVAGRRNPLPGFAEFIAKRSDPATPLRIAIGHALCEEKALTLEAVLKQRMPQIEASSVCELGSALGVHCGPGALVVGVQPVRNRG